LGRKFKEKMKKKTGQKMTEEWLKKEEGQE
jgi:hypothetical protein